MSQKMKFHKLLLQVSVCLSLIGLSVERFGTLLKETKNGCDSCQGEDGMLHSDCLTAVGCKCNSKVLDCSDLNMRVLPSQISFTVNTSVAIFKDNHIVDIKDDTFYSGNELIELDLSNNEISFVSIKAFVAFTNLKRLLLNHNGLYSLPPPIFDGLHQLRVLDLSQNMLKTLLSDVFSHLTELRELKLEANPLHILEPKQFEHLSKLESLDLESTLLENISDYMFSFTPGLKMLGLANNRLEKVPSKAFQVLRKLNSLDLSGNPIKTIDSRAFYGMKALARLRLNRMPLLKQIQKHAFGDLNFLRELHCSYNYELSFIDKDAFVSEEEGSKIISLNVITLSQNNLETISPNLLPWSTSMELHLDGNAWSCDCRMEWILHIKLKNSFQSQMRCFDPVDIQHRLVINLTAADFTCEISTGGMIFLICLSALSILLLIGIVGCFIYKRRKNILSANKPYFRVSKKTNEDEVVYDRNLIF